jgi:hypothetical protein
MAKVIQVIEAEVIRGDGSAANPTRGVNQYWSLEGNLLAENDPVENRKRAEAARDRRFARQEEGPA